MRMLWSKSKDKQLDLLDAATEEDVEQPASATRVQTDRDLSVAEAVAQPPLSVSVECLLEDTGNPRTEFPESEIDELADDIRQHGILQPIVVHPADAAGRYRIHFGAKRLRAATRAGLQEVPVVIRVAPADPYAQVAENQKRHGLTPLDMARFIKSRVDAGDSNATIAKRLGMDATTVAHHIALLELPPELDEAMRAGRCTSPRTLYELTKLHREQPERLKELVAGCTEITRAALAAFRAEQLPAATGGSDKRDATSLLAQANSACGRLELTLTRIKQVEQQLVETDLAALRQRIANLASGSE
jgi:ParB family chromosome partitioning protein